MEFLSEEKGVPRFLSEEENRRFAEKRLSHILLPRVRERGHVFLTASGICFTFGKVFTDSTYHKAFSKLHYLLQVHYNLFFKKKKKIDEPLLYIHSPWSVVNYHHWIVDSLPRLYPFIKDIEKRTVLLPETLKSVDFVQQSLQLLGVRNIVYLSGNDVAFLKKLEYAELTPGDFMLTGHLKPTIDLLKSNVKTPTGPGFRKIYLSRQETGYRTVANQKETEEVLQNLGFEKLETEKLSFQEQITLFNEAKVLVSIHGAGLTNCVFMPQGSVVYELHPTILPYKSIFNYCYWNLASHFGLHYYFQGCDPVDFKERFHTADLTVDTVKLQNQLTSILTTV